MLDYPLLGLAVAILPLPVAYLLGWRLLRHADDPTFAEEWFRLRTNMAKLAVGAWVVASVLAGRWAAAWVVVAALSSWIGNFRSHKRLHNEAWSLGEFLVWRARYALGVVTFWILLLAAPLLIAVYGREWALPLLVILVAWQIGHERILLRALDAQPIADDALNMRFAAIVQKATCPEPRIVSIGPRRGFFANAFALPGTPRGSVLLTDTLLRCLEPDETAAIFAHEIAHLEEHTPRKTSRRRGQTSGWLVFGILVTWAVAGDSGSAALAFSIIWILLLIGPAMASRRRHAAHEAASDARAVELCGDAPALIRGLTKTHLLSRLPRRWDSAREARLTHPSLARRIQALRSKYGLAEDDEAPATEPFETLVLKSRKRAGEYFLLDLSGARWLEDVPRQTPENAETLASAARASQQIPFCDLTALHVRPTMTGPVLVLRLGANETQSFPMHHHDAAAVQAALDRLDIHLGAAPPERATPLARAMPRIVTAFAFILSATAGSIPAMLAAVIAFVTPAPPTMAAAGAAAVVVALAALPGYTSSAGPDQRDLHLFALGVLGVFGIIALGLAFRSRGDRRPRRSSWVVIAIMLASALIGAFPLFVTRDALVVSLVARTRPSLVVSLAALTAALAFAPHRRARLASIFALLLLVATIYAATPSFARAYVVDPLVASHAPREVGPPTLLSSTVCDQSIDRSGSRPTACTMSPGCAPTTIPRAFMTLRSSSVGGKVRRWRLVRRAKRAS